LLALTQEGEPAYKMWGDTLIIDHLISSASQDDLRAKEEDKLVLGWEQRRWARGRFTTAKGRRIGIALPTGSMLAPDAILWIGPDWYLRIEAAAESVLEVFPADSKHAVLIAYEVGNRHFPLALRDNKLLVPDDKAMIRLMDRLGAPWERKQAVFDPIGNTQLHAHG
jgi:urease accessory protein